MKDVLSNILPKYLNLRDYLNFGLSCKEYNNLVNISKKRDETQKKIQKLFPSDKITACALQSEGVNPKPNVIKELKGRFKHIFVLYDNDYYNPNNPGRAAGKKVCDMFDLLQIEIPDFFQLKDPSDFRESKGEVDTRNMLLKLMRDKLNIKP